MASSSSTNNKSNGQDPLNCPRCNSTNTKFCYYNNYSLSQPRHFCKSCKRYWTRGGTLRNVPVGGGFRRNKRLLVVKRPPPPPPSSSAAVNPMLFYSQLPFSGFSSSTARVCSTDEQDDRTAQMNGFGLGFSSGLLVGGGDEQCHNYENSPVFLGSSSSFAPGSTMASLLASGLHHQNGFPGLMPYEDIQNPGWKEVGTENENGSGRNNNPNPVHDEQINNDFSNWFDS
ncbi:hypothetical protein ABFS82_08G141000 [Erythranthe guttata]|uniref:Dof zinc finger protein n=1 Tax=Erythranthe guttata TaxID=4155 RepID=A0A022RTJ8_ERYGU|nr:PREDICTED: dof zinc finger protein DOF3.1-like [Erythranthe guttata]EYU43384.1 hypothetical protein MIMGU_mgv11b015854mg [Erythranthe guttata]|eukprot:XP_012830510.1 PREDICTED: dof zinc finger protein DOF3.1-like [Erythranthe guttata]